MTDDGRGGRNESPSGSLPRIDLGSPPVPINRMRILQETDRPGGPAAPRAACSVKLGLALGELCEMVGFSLPEISREEAQKSESEFVTETTER